MGSIHLDFSEDTVPGSERHNEHAHADFDWEGLFRACDADLEEAHRRVESRDYTALGEAISVILRAILASKDNHGRGWLEAVGRKAMAVSFVFDQRILGGANASRMAEELAISKQSFFERARQVEEFIKRHPAKKAKVVRQAIDDASASSHEEKHPESPAGHPRGCEVADDLRADDSAPSASGDPSA